MSNTAHTGQPWLRNAAFDVPYILLPALLALAVTLMLPAKYRSTDEMPLAAWVILVLLIDVAHVYSTLFRTYFDGARFRKFRALYIAVPICCFAVGVLLYSVSALLFWRLLAYLAVFHFIRQQYGFMRLYSRFEQRGNWKSASDVVAIYAATLYPIIYWHCSPGRNFDWFVKGDFLITEMTLVRDVAWYLYCIVMAAWLAGEVYTSVRQRAVNIPKVTVIAGTALSWYFGIVYFNGDMAFTLLNVVAHGVPYMALIWLVDAKERRQKPVATSFLSPAVLRLGIFLAVIFVFAWLEEGLWDGLVWRERAQVFGLFSFLPQMTSKEALAILVPLLSLPQTTHYVLDGFIWQRKHTV